MTKARDAGQRGTLSVVLCAVLTLLLAAGPAGAANLKNARIFFEFNLTDDDLGVQVFLDADAWRTLTLVDPGGNPILQMDAHGVLGILGLTELFWESSEPSPQEVLALFAPGQYTFEVTDVDGNTLTGMVTLSHDLPLPAVVTFPEEDGSVDPADTTISWTHPQLNQLAAFEVVVENVTSGVLTAAFTLPASATTVHIAPEALTGPGKKYKVEVIAIAKNGNKTIVEVPFSTQ